MASLKVNDTISPLLAAVLEVMQSHRCLYIMFCSLLICLVLPLKENIHPDWIVFTFMTFDRRPCRRCCVVSIKNTASCLLTRSRTKSTIIHIQYINRYDLKLCRMQEAYPRRGHFGLDAKMEQWHTLTHIFTIQRCQLTHNICL